MKQKIPTNYVIKKGDFVWYKEETSYGNYRDWTRWEVTEILEKGTYRPRLLLRFLLPKMRTKGRSISGLAYPKYDYVVVDLAWIYCFPDVPKVRTLVKKWNTAKKLSQEIEIQLELMEEFIS